MGLAALTAVDFFSDILFAYTTEAKGWLVYLRYASVACLIIPLATNMALSLQFIKGLQAQGHTKVMLWFQSHQLMSGMMLFAGAFNVELMTLMNSYLFHKESFKAPISEYSSLMLKSLGLYTNVLEDFPQVMIQGFFLFWTGQINLITTISLSLSGLALIHGILTRRLAKEIGNSTADKTHTRFGELLSAGEFEGSTDTVGSAEGKADIEMQNMSSLSPVSLERSPTVVVSSDESNVPKSLLAVLSEAVDLLEDPALTAAAFSDESLRKEVAQIFASGMEEARQAAALGQRNENFDDGDTAREGEIGDEEG
jgi:hypothetical protein